MSNDAAVRGKSSAAGILDFELNWSSAVVALTLVYLAAGVACFIAWQISRKDALIEFFFQVPGALLTLFFAATGVIFSGRVLRELPRGQGLRTAWQLLTVAAAFDLTGTVLSQILTSNPTLNILPRLGIDSVSLHRALQYAGFVAGGALRYSLLAAGLFSTLLVYRKTRFLAKFRLIDAILLSTVIGYVLREGHDLVVALQQGKKPDLIEVLGWPVDPLLCVLLAEAILLLRSARQMGHGLAGRCWKAFGIGIALVVLGDISSWATNYGYLQWPWNSLTWFIWLPVETAFALGPIYQFEAISQASALRRASVPPRIL